MQNELKEKLDTLREVHGWDEILIKHNQEGAETVGIHELFVVNEDVEGNKTPETLLGWTINPIFVADDLPSLQQRLEKLLDLVKSNLVTTEEELTNYNALS